MTVATEITAELNTPAHCWLSAMLDTLCMFFYSHQQHIILMCCHLVAVLTECTVVYMYVTYMFDMQLVLYKLML